MEHWTPGRIKFTSCEWVSNVFQRVIYWTAMVSSASNGQTLLKKKNLHFETLSNFPASGMSVSHDIRMHRNSEKMLWSAVDPTVFDRISKRVPTLWELFHSFGKVLKDLF